MRIFFYLGCFAALCGMLVATESVAASFGCAAPRSNIEISVCTDAETSQLDDTLSRNFNSALQRLSEPGKQILRDGQTKWLSYVNDVCFQYKNDAGGAACVKEKYKARIKNLEAAAVQIGPYVFSRVDVFAVKGDDSGGRPVDIHIAYPRIDKPSSDNTETWNALVAQGHAASSPCGEGAGDVKVGFEVEAATPDLISILTDNYTSCHSSSKATEKPQAKNFLMSPYVRLLRPADLFNDATEWKDFLGDRCVTALNEKTDGQGLNKELVKKVASQPSSWTLNKTGLTVRIAPYDILGDSFTETDVEISWDNLKPYLATDAKVPR